MKNTAHYKLNTYTTLYLEGSLLEMPISHSKWTDLVTRIYETLTILNMIHVFHIHEANEVEKIYNNDKMLVQFYLINETSNSFLFL